MLQKSTSWNKLLLSEIGLDQEQLCETVQRQLSRAIHFRKNLKKKPVAEYFF